MNDYSDIIYLIGAMIVFSLLSLQTNQIFNLNERVELNSELEYNAVSIAQDQIDQIRWISTQTQFDNYLKTFPQTKSIAVDNDTLFYNVDVTDTAMNVPNSNVINRKVLITVTNKFLKNNSNEAPGNRSVKLKYLKSFTN